MKKARLFSPLTNFYFPIVKNQLWIPAPVLVGSLAYLSGLGPVVWIPASVAAPFVYPFGRWHLWHSNQDLSGDLYLELVNEIGSALENSNKKPLIYGVGHDHSLQILQCI